MEIYLFKLFKEKKYNDIEKICIDNNFNIDLNNVNKYNQSLLHLFITNSIEYSIVRKLIINNKNKINTNILDFNDNNVLFVSLIYEKYNIFKLLVNNIDNIDLSIVNNNELLLIDLLFKSKMKNKYIFYLKLQKINNYKNINDEKITLYISKDDLNIHKFICKLEIDHIDDMINIIYNFNKLNDDYIYNILIKINDYNKFLFLELILTILYSINDIEIYNINIDKLYIIYNKLLSYKEIKEINYNIFDFKNNEFHFKIFQLIVENIDLLNNKACLYEFITKCNIYQFIEYALNYLKDISSYLFGFLIEKKYYLLIRKHINKIDDETKSTFDIYINYINNIKNNDMDFMLVDMDIFRVNRYILEIEKNEYINFELYDKIYNDEYYELLIHYKDKLSITDIMKNIDKKWTDYFQKNYKNLIWLFRNDDEYMKKIINNTNYITINILNILKFIKKNHLLYENNNLKIKTENHILLFKDYDDTKKNNKKISLLNDDSIIKIIDNDIDSLYQNKDFYLSNFVFNHIFENGNYKFLFYYLNLLYCINDREEFNSLIDIMKKSIDIIKYDISEILFNIDNSNLYILKIILNDNEFIINNIIKNNMIIDYDIIISYNIL